MESKFFERHVGWKSLCSIYIYYSVLFMLSSQNSGLPILDGGLRMFAASVHVGGIRVI